MVDRHDYVALEWVKGEIDETLKQARQMLEAYVENPEDRTRLKFCLTYLHQVHGTLQMVEFYGAALLSEEMERLAQALVEEKVRASEDSLAILMQAIIQLPNYLDKVRAGYKDLPVVLLPLLNELRAARGEPLMSETALFQPDMSAAKPSLPPINVDEFDNANFQDLMRKLRQMYQYALIGVLRGQELPVNFGYIAKVFTRLGQVGGKTALGQMWWVATAFIEGLSNQSIELSSASKSLLKQLDNSLKAVVDEGSMALSKFADDDLIKNLLYYIAKVESDSALIKEVKATYRLANALPNEEEINQSAQDMAGPDRDAVENVVAALMEELGQIKDELDLLVRRQAEDPESMSVLIPGIKQVADTMAVLGMGIPRKVLQEQIDTIESAISSGQMASEGTLMDIAGALLYVEATLSGIADESSISSDNDSLGGQLDGAQEAVVREARNGLEQTKDGIVEFIGSQWNSETLSALPDVLYAVRGGLMMVPLTRAARVVEACAKYIKTSLLEDQVVPEWESLDALADVIMGVEYYLERLAQDGRGGNELLLEKAEASIAKLGFSVDQLPEIPTGVNENTSQESDEIELDVDSLEVPEPALSEFEENELEIAEPEIEGLDVASLEDDDSFEPIAEDITAETPLEEVSFDEPAELDSLAELEDLTQELSQSGDNDGLIELTNDLDELSNELQPIEPVEFESELPEDLSVEVSFPEPEEMEPVSLEPEPTSNELPVAQVEEDENEDDLIDDEIIEIFIEEAGEVLEAIEEFFPKFKENNEDKDSLTEFRRAFHTLKGSGRMVGAHVVGELAWSIESMLNRHIDGSVTVSEPFIKVIEEVTDIVPSLVKAFENRTKPDTTVVDQLAEKAWAISRNEWVEPAIAVEEPSIDEAPLEPLTLDESSTLDSDLTIEPADNTDKESPRPEEIAEPANQLLDIFTNELDKHLAVIDDFVATKISQPLTDKLQRALHTIKGSAHMAGIHDIAEMVTPAEKMVKQFQELHIIADVEIIAVLSKISRKLKLAVDQLDQYKDVSEVTTKLVANIENLHRSRIAELNTPENQSENNDDPSLMSIFLSQSMDIVLDAESILEKWQSEGLEATELDRLLEELSTLSKAAKAVDLIPIASLSAKLSNVYQRLDRNSAFEENFFTDVNEGHEALISMMDRLAAGQSIRINEQIETLIDNVAQSLPELSELPDAPVEEVIEPVSIEPVVEEPIAETTLTVEEPELVESKPTQASVPGTIYIVEGDEELVEIFLEEANEIIESIQNSLHNWQSDTNNLVEVEALQRDLHTLKGGARMAEIRPVGDLAHELEFLYEGLCDGKYQAEQNLFGLLQACHDSLGDMIADVENNNQCTSADHLVEQINAYRSGTSIEDVQIETVELKPAAPIPTLEAPVPAKREYNIDSSDEIDFDILEIFIDEAAELLHELDGAIHSWQDSPDNELYADELKRVLHTLKGGARLAKLKSLGDLSHDFETFIIRSQQDKVPLDKTFFENILGTNDELASAVESLQSLMESRGEQGAIGPSVIGQVEEYITEAPEEPKPLELVSDSTSIVEDEPLLPDASVAKEQMVESVVAPVEPENNVVPLRKPEQPKKPEPSKRSQPQETVKVQANLLEGLVNLAGETSIARSRLEQEVTDFGFTLEEMDSTIDRLREQVRRLDVETEEQMTFRQEKAEETNYTDFDPLEMDRYSSIQQLSRSLMESASDLLDLKSTLTDKTRDAETLLLQQSRINTELQEGLMQTRMVPFSRLVPRLRRIVRQTAQELGKQVEFDVENADGELDRTVLERMISPLEHMLRNGVDHGIEMPDERTQAGKNAQGNVILNLSREGGDVVLRLRDDGKGIDINVIKEKAIERGLMTSDAELTDEEILLFILDAGFSTAAKVTQISGRGVGMDVVHSEVKQLGGSMSINTELGGGTVFTIRIPFTVSVNRALMVGNAEDMYAIPLNTIEGIVRVTPAQLLEYYQPGAPLFEYGGRNYRLQYLGSLVKDDMTPHISDDQTAIPLILVKGVDSNHSIALHVDQLMGSREIVVKTLGAQFANVAGLSGATILGDGSVVVILELGAMIRHDLALDHVNVGVSIGQQPVEAEVVDEEDRVIKVMVCDDSVTVRKVTSRLLERNGFEVILAKDGADAVAQLQEVVPDAMLLDIEMPRMDGFEVAQRIRHDDRLKGIPIIMITSRTGEKHKERALSIGVNEYMGKPFQEATLLATIERLTLQKG